MIKADDIILEGNPLLKEKSIDVELPLSKEDEETMIKMIEYIENSMDEEIASQMNLIPSVGIAAVQIGILKRMLVCWSYDEAGNEHFYPMINPKIISYSEEKTYLTSGEACLSVPRDVPGLIHRARRITVDTYLYLDGKTVKTRLHLKDYIAIVFQHEFDHLNGILFPERINQEFPFLVVDNSVPVKFKEQED